MPKPTNKKEAIAQTALQLFAERGYASTPISMIAREAGVSQGLLYNFFPSKEALLRELINMGAADIALSMESYSSIKDPKEAIRAHVERTIDIIVEKKEFWRLLHAVRLQRSVLEGIDDEFREIAGRATRVFGGVFRKLKYPNPDLESILFLAQIDGLVILYIQNEDIPIRKLSRQLIKRYTQ